MPNPWMQAATKTTNTAPIKAVARACSGKAKGKKTSALSKALAKMRK